MMKPLKFGGSEPPISVDEARAILQPFEQDLWDACNYGVAELRDLLGTKPWIADNARAQATNVNAAAGHYLTHKWFDTGGIRKLGEMPPIPRHLCFMVQEKVVVRIKQADSTGATRNYPTSYHLTYMGQEPLPDMPPGVPRLIVGYVIDPLRITLTDIKVILPNGTVNFWAYSIPPRPEIDEDGQTSLRLDVPPPAGPRIVPKRTDSQEQKKVGNGEH